MVTTSGGTINFYSKSTRENTKVTTDRNAVVKNEVKKNDGTTAREQVIFANGTATAATENKGNLSEFKIGNATGADIFTYVLSLDGKSDNLSKADFDKINEQDLKGKFGRDVKVKIEEGLKAIISYTYSNGEQLPQKATLTIDLESDTEKSARVAREEAKKAEEKQKEAELKAAKQKEMDAIKQRVDKIEERREAIRGFFEWFSNLIKNNKG